VRLNWRRYMGFFLFGVGIAYLVNALADKIPHTWSWDVFFFVMLVGVGASLLSQEKL
jgi:hypothetical protein